MRTDFSGSAVGLPGAVCHRPLIGGGVTGKPTGYASLTSSANSRRQTGKPNKQRELQAKLTARFATTFRFATCTYFSEQGGKPVFGPGKRATG